MVVLVAVLVMIGLPMAMPGMGMPPCQECGPALLAGSACALFVLVGFTLFFAMLIELVWARRYLRVGLLRASPFDRPPQLGLLA